MASYALATKILDGTISLGRAHITPGTLTIDGQAPSADFVLDYPAGTIRRADGVPVERAVHQIAFQYDDSYETPAFIAVAEAAEGQAAAIPGWAGWTMAEFTAWHDANIAGALPVANLAAANALLATMSTELRAMGRMLVALRNRTFPGLQE